MENYCRGYRLGGRRRHWWRARTNDRPTWSTGKSKVSALKKKIHIYEQCNEMQSCLILNFSQHKLESVINQYLFITFSSLKRSKCLYFCQKKTLINTRLTCSYSLLG